MTNWEKNIINAFKDHNFTSTPKTGAEKIRTMLSAKARAIGQASISTQWRITGEDIV